MPKYQDIRTYETGFYNNYVVNGQNTRTYNVEDLSEHFAGIFTDGIKPNEFGVLGEGLAVEKVSGMTIQVKPGHALFNKKYFRNKANYQITLDDATSETRYDCVVVRSDKNKDVNDTYIYVKSLNHLPTSADLERLEDESVKEFMLAYVMVQGEYNEIHDGAIFDTRIDESVCGLITGLYRSFSGKEIYNQWQEEFNLFIEKVKEQLDGLSIFTRYYQSEYTTSVENEKIIPIQIAEYEKEFDGLMVNVNGRLFKENANYKILNNNEIELTLALPLAGTRVTFEVLKSIDTSHDNTIIKEVGDLQKQVDELEKSGKYQYNCNGATDNIKLSNLIKEFLEKDRNNSTYDTYTIYVNVVFGADAMFSGDGSASNEYHLINASLGSDRNRKVVLDFANCSTIRINCDDDKYYIMFYGMNVNIKNCNIVAIGSRAFIKMFSNSASTKIYAENCKFYITAYNNSYIARSGTFINCKTSLTIINGDAYSFNVDNESLVRIIGGEHYAYTGNSTSKSAIIYVASSYTNAVVITYAVNIPTVARSGYYQTNAIYCLSNNSKCSFTNIITTLKIDAKDQNIIGTIIENKPNMM